MQTEPVQTAAQIRAQLSQMKSELADIARSMPGITSTTDLLGAQAEQRDHEAVIKLLEQRLQDALDRERAQEKLDKRQALEQQRDNAREDHDRLDLRFEGVMSEIEEFILDRFPQADEVAWERDGVSRQHADACFQLRGRTEDYSGSDQLSSDYGWYSKSTPGADSPIRQVLFEVYASRHRITGRLQLPGQSDGYRPMTAPRPQQPDELDQDDDFRARLSAEFAEKRAQNGS